MLVSYAGFLFLQGSFNLINFDRKWFLLHIDLCEPGVIQGCLSLNFNLFLDFFFRGASQVKTQTFQGKFYRIFQCLYQMKAENYPIPLRNNQVQNFLDQILTSLLIIIGFRVRGIKKDIRSYQKLWKVVR